MKQEPKRQKAITTIDIDGAGIKTIPEGTTFEVSHIHEDWSVSHGLGITQIWNDEYKLVGARDAES